MKHRGLTLIGIDHPDWVHIKELCSLANNFCDEFGVSKERGYKTYIRLGIEKMKQYSLYKFKTLHTSICSTFEAMLEIETDPHNSLTDDLFTEYVAKINERLGDISIKDYKHPDKYVCFVRATADATKLGLDPETYIKAQFSALEWANALPEPPQLYGDKAIERARKYCFQNNIKTGQKKKSFNFSKIKNL